MTDAPIPLLAPERRAPAWITAATSLALGLAAVSVGGCGDTAGGDAQGGAAPRTVTIEVDDNVFEPDTVHIAIGDTVRWEWVGQEPHNVRSAEFESPVQQAGHFQHTFEAAGRADYVCIIHPGMAGTVEVTAA